MYIISKKSVVSVNNCHSYNIPNKENCLGSKQLLSVLSNFCSALCCPIHITDCCKALKDTCTAMNILII